MDIYSLYVFIVSELDLVYYWFDSFESIVLYETNWRVP